MDLVQTLESDPRRGKKSESQAVNFIFSPGFYPPMLLPCVLDFIREILVMFSFLMLGNQLSAEGGQALGFYPDMVLRRYADVMAQTFVADYSDYKG